MLCNVYSKKSKFVDVGAAGRIQINSGYISQQQNTILSFYFIFSSNFDDTSYSYIRKGKLSR